MIGGSNRVASVGEHGRTWPLRSGVGVLFVVALSTSFGFFGGSLVEISHCIGNSVGVVTDRAVVLDLEGSSSRGINDLSANSSRGILVYNAFAGSRDMPNFVTFVAAKGSKETGFSSVVGVASMAAVGGIGDRMFADSG